MGLKMRSRQRNFFGYERDIVQESMKRDWMASKLEERKQGS